MPRPKEKVVATLKSKGFSEEPGDHIILVYYTTDGRKTNARTFTSHSPKMRDISDALLSQMARQCKLTRSEFLELADCPMRRERLEQVLREKGVI